MQRIALGILVYTHHGVQLIVGLHDVCIDPFPERFGSTFLDHSKRSSKYPTVAKLGSTLRHNQHTRSGGPICVCLLSLTTQSDGFSTNTTKVTNYKGAWLNVDARTRPLQLLGDPQTSPRQCDQSRVSFKYGIPILKARCQINTRCSGRLHAQSLCMSRHLLVAFCSRHSDIPTTSAVVAACFQSSDWLHYCHRWPAIVTGLRH
jgi:hypothetical protein